MPLTVTVVISDIDVLALKNDLLDIDDWVQKAVAGKINHCKKRMLRSGTDAMIKDPAFTDAIPSGEAELITLIASKTKDRVAREAEVDA
jgi:hypothetical protein